MPSIHSLSIDNVILFGVSSASPLVAFAVLGAEPRPSFQEKAPFAAKADKRKAEYENTLQAYNKRLNDGPGAEEEESDKSRSEVNDENDEDDGSDEEDDDDDDE